MQKVVIVGNSVLAETMYEYLVRDPRYAPVAFAVDAGFIKASEFRGLPVCELATLEERFPSCDHSLVLAIGYTDLLRIRERLFQRLHQTRYTILRYLHGDARIYTDNLGEGVWILPGAFVDALSRVANNTVVWGNCSIAHGATVHENCWLATGCVISAGVDVGKNTFVGVNATVLNNVVVGSHNIIGAGAILTKSTPDYAVVVAPSSTKVRFRSDEFIKTFKM